MTSTEHTSRKTDLDAIDVAEGRNEILIELPEARRRRRLTVTNCRGEHDRFVAELQALGRPVPIGLGLSGIPCVTGRLNDTVIHAGRAVLPRDRRLLLAGS